MFLKKEVIKLKNAVLDMKDNECVINTKVNSKELDDLKIVFEKHTRRLVEKNKDAERKNRQYEQFLAENQNMHSDRIIAKQMQESMLPKSYPAFPEFPNIDLFADMDYANEAGGDFYDYFKINSNSICFSVADIEGKGIPAAMYMAVAKTMIQLNLEGGEQLSEVFSSVNKQLCLSSMQKRFITMWTGILDVNTGNLKYINAGHNAPILKKSSEKAKLLKNRSGLPLASYYSKKRPNLGYEMFEETLSSGDILVLYTDGITEALGANGELFGEKRLLELVDLYSQKGGTSKEMSAYIRRQVLLFSNNTLQDDDMTLLVLKIK